MVNHRMSLEMNEILNFDCYSLAKKTRKLKNSDIEIASRIKKSLKMNLKLHNSKSMGRVTYGGQENVAFFSKIKAKRD